MSIDRRGRGYRVRWYMLNGKPRARQCPDRKTAEALQREILSAKALGRDWGLEHSKIEDPKSARTIRALRKVVSELRAKAINGEPARASSAEVPAAINRIGHLLKSVPIVPVMVGIYFLIDNDAVVYIGQSVDVARRVSEHLADKVFDCAYLLPVPEEMLDLVEGAFIRRLNPKLNKDRGAVPFVDDAAVLSRYGIAAAPPAREVAP